jgi:hypothetical protein
MRLMCNEKFTHGHTKSWNFSVPMPEVLVVLYTSFSLFLTLLEVATQTTKESLKATVSPVGKFTVKL